MGGVTGAVGRLWTYTGWSEVIWEQRLKEIAAPACEFWGTGQTKSGVGLAGTQNEHRESSGGSQSAGWGPLRRNSESSPGTSTGT